MNIEERRALYLSSLQYLMKPVVRFCLRRSIGIQEFYSVAKIVFVSVADEEIGKTTSKINVSRISVMTGLNRGEVHRLYREKEPAPTQPLSLLGRVIGQWRHDPRFTTKAGEPRLLSFEGEGSEFQDLAHSVSKNVNHGTIFFELKRIGAVEETPKGLKLLKQIYGMGSDPKKGFELLAHDVDTMFNSIEENIEGEPKISNLHISTEYDNIVAKQMPVIRGWLITEGKAFHKKVRKFLSKYDKDVNPKLAKEHGGARVSVSAFSFTADKK